MMARTGVLQKNRVDFARVDDGEFQSERSTIFLRCGGVKSREPKIEGDRDDAEILLGELGI